MILPPYTMDISFEKESMESMKNKNQTISVFTINDTIAMILLILILYACKAYNYLLFHSISEMISVLVAFGIFVVIWVTRRRIDDDGFMAIFGAGYLNIGIIDLLHTFTFKGMGIAADGTNIPTQLWIGARYLESVIFLTALVLMKRKLKLTTITIMLTFLSLGFILVVLKTPWFPDCFIEDKGLTDFKIWSEYTICFIFISALLFLLFKVKKIDRNIKALLTLSVVTAILQEFVFTLYTTPYDFFNESGHYLKIISFGFLFKAFFITNIQEPSKLLYNNLREREAHYRSLMELSPYAIFILKKGLIADINSAALKILGAETNDKIINKNLLNFIHIDSYKEVETRINAQFTNFLKSDSFEAKIVNLDGKLLYGEIGLTPISDNENNSSQVILRDITEQKKVLEERQKTINFLRIVNNSKTTNELLRDVITYFHKDSNCDAVGIRLNDRDDFPYFETRGFSEEFVISEGRIGKRNDKGEIVRDSDGKPALECMCGNILSGHFDSVKPYYTEFGSFWTNSTSQLFRSVTTDEIPKYTRENCTDSGYESVALIPLKVGTKRIGLLQLNSKCTNTFTFEEIESWERLCGHFAIALAKFQSDDQIKQHAEKLAQTIKELETFSYSLSHDLRAPLHIINGFADILLQDYGDKQDENSRMYLQRIKNAGERMNCLINDILKLSKVTRQEMTINTVDLTSMSRLLIEELRCTEPSRNVEVQIHNALEIKGDGSLLQLALSNLISNAWKYTSKNEVSRIEIGKTKIGNKNAFFISDNGAGFNIDNSENLFIPFRRLHSDSEFPGTGVGLAIVERVIKRHNGSVWADSAVGKGATFFFTIDS